VKICFPEIVIFHDYLVVAWSICFIFNLDLWDYRLLLALNMIFYEFLIKFCILLLMNCKLMGLFYFSRDFSWKVFLS
jgi:hypothetical protein